MKSVNSNTISGILAVLLCMLTLMFFACNTTSDTSNNDLDTCSVNFKVAVNRASDNNTVSRALDEILNCNEIYDVEADIFDPDNALLQQGGPWDCEVGQGTVTDVPAGTDGTLAVLCNNEAGEVVYRGVSVITLIPGATVDAGTVVTDEFMPSQLSPADNATEINGNVYFEWTAVAGAAEYDIQVIGPSTLEYTTSDTNYRAHDLTTPSTTHTWQIRAVDSQGNHGVWSSELSFITDSNIIPTTSITSPSGNVSGNVLFDQSSSDSDGNIASYVWTLVETGEVIDTAATFTKSDLALGNHTVQLVVTDNVGAIKIATSTFTVTEQTGIGGTWSLSATNEQTGDCQSYEDKVSNGTIIDMGDNTYSIQLDTLWDRECDTSSPPCLFYGSYANPTYTFTNSWTDNSSGYDYLSIIMVTAQGNDSYTGTLATTESNATSTICAWTYDITLTRQ